MAPFHRSGKAAWQADAGLFVHYAGRAYSAFRASTVVDRLAWAASPRWTPM
jgi:hypothetical protein